jgi:hypothetical protein
MTYREAIRELNDAAHAAFQAGGGKTASPYTDLHSLRLICRETDRLVDCETHGGFTNRRIQGTT